MCAVMHNSKQYPGRLYLGLSIMHISAGWSYLQELNVEVKPSRLLPACFFYRGRCPRLPTSASRCVLPSRQIIPFFTLRSSLKQWFILVYRLIVFWEACAPMFLSIVQIVESSHSRKVWAILRNKLCSENNQGFIRFMFKHSEKHSSKLDVFSLVCTIFAEK